MGTLRDEYVTFCKINYTLFSGSNHR